MKKFCLFSLFLLLSCHQEEAIDSQGTESEVSFMINLAESTSRAALVESTEQMGSIGIYCAHTLTEPWDTGSLFSKMSNKQLYYNNATAQWQYDGETPTWGNSTVTDKYTFFAYSPYVIEDEDKYISPSIVDGTLVVKYSVPEECTEQVDLMLSQPRKDIYPQVGGSVQLDFKHTLAAIAFSLKGEPTYSITEIYISNVISSGEVSISDEGDVVWKTSDELSELNYSALIDKNGQAGLDIPTPLTLENGYLMMIPQDVEEVKIVATILDSETKEQTEKHFTLNGFDDWQAGEVYTYTINLGSYDYTIEGTSNCYILHPDNQDQTFYIPVEGRINTFWRDYAGDESVEGMLSSTDQWTTTILWHDIAGGINGFSAERTTLGFTPNESVTAFCTPDFTTPGCQSAMKITLPSTLDEGNILVGVEFNGQILWSWHFWITSYDPDSLAEICRSRIQNDRKVYSTRHLEGEVHRLNDTGDIWSVLYDQKFMMDRNLGARSCYYASDQLGILHYQYARKDPFPYTFTPSLEENRVTFAQAVRNPTTFYTQGNTPYSWSAEGLINNDQYLWGDVNVRNDPNVTGKSIFDPSPLGWKVPRNGTFDVLDTENCKHYSDENILLYDNQIVFPMSGFRSNQSGESSGYDSQGNLRTSTALDDSKAYNLVYNPDISEGTNNTRADGFCIRCIEE